MTFLEWLSGLAAWSPWAPALTTSAIVSVAGLALGVVYKARIEKGIQAGFDRDLEKLRSELRTHEQQAKDVVEKQRGEINALRSGALSGMASRQALLDKRRIEALERIWAAATACPEFKLAARFAETLNMKAALEESNKATADADNVRAFADALWKSAGLDKMKKEAGEAIVQSDRLFVPPMVWALRSAHNQLLTHPAVQLAAIKSGVGGKLLADEKPLLETAKASLPDFGDFIDKFGADAIPHLIEPMEQALFQSLSAALISTSSDEKTIEQAAEILRLANLASQNERGAAPRPPDVVRARQI